MTDDEQQSKPKLTLPELTPVAEPEDARPCEDDDAPKAGAHFKSEAEQKRQRWPFVVGIILAFILLVGGGTYWYLSNQTAQIEASREEGYDLLDDAIALIQ
ncbi:MAG: hypothetical protein LBU48_07840, partial [Coriobacteriales bacterium]|nr:hypothetical protein [Coriobacteriales bacterium]